MSEYIVTGTGGSRQATSTERVQIVAGVQGPAGRDGTVFRWLGEWQSGVTYTADDAVYDPATGAAYLCIATNLNDPPAGSGNWSVLADPTVGMANHITQASADHDHYQNRMGWPLIGDSPGAYFTSLAYDQGTRTITLAADSEDSLAGGGANFRYYRLGQRVTKTGPLTLQHSASEGGYFFYFDENDDFVVSTDPWNLALHVPVAYVYWNGISEGIGYEERHTIYRDPLIHEALHHSIGTFIQEGFALTGYTLDTGTTAATRPTLGPGIVRDEDLASGTTQKASGAYTVAYRSGATGAWLFSKAKIDPVMASTYVQWNEFTGATWQLTSAANGKYVNYFVFATPALDGSYEVLWVPGQGVHDTLAEAESEVLESLQIGGLIAQEIAGIWRIIYKTNSGYSSTGKVAIRQVDQIFAQRSGSVTAAAPTDHQTLSGRSEANSHPASAIANTPAGDIVATDVQAAIEELDTEKFPRDGSETLDVALGTLSDLSVNTTAEAAQTGLLSRYSHVVELVSLGVTTLYCDNSAAIIGNGRWLGWSGADPAAGHDVILARAAAGTLDMKNGTNEQNLRIWGAGVGDSYLDLRSDAIYGTDLGVNGSLKLGANGTWSFDIDPNICYTRVSINPYTTMGNALDLGTSGYPWRNLYIGTSVVTPLVTSTGALNIYAPAAQQLGLGAAGAVAWNISTSGHLIPVSANTYNLASAANYIATVYSNIFRTNSGGSTTTPALACQSNVDTGIFLPSTDSYKPHVSHDDVDQGQILCKGQDAARMVMGGNVPSPTGPATYTVRRFNAAGTIVAAYAIVTGGTSVTVNAQNNGSDIRSSDLAVTAGAGWTSFGTLQNTTVTAGQSLTIEIVSVSGSPSEVAIQIEVQPS